MEVYIVTLLAGSTPAGVISIIAENTQEAYRKAYKYCEYNNVTIGAFYCQDDLWQKTKKHFGICKLS